MAFAFTKNNETVAGDLRFTSGTFTNTSGGTGGNIYTGLQQVHGVILQHNSSAVVADQPVLNETFPMQDPVTIVTTADADGYWQAWGY